MSDPVLNETWMPLSSFERRVLGVLVEKQKTSKSADAYPLTLNSLTTGCNQKSNRDPVMELDDDQIEETLTQLQRRGLATKITGGRAERYRHLLYEAWKVSKVELAILAELLLRGAQTEGDLRGRASRMDDIKDLDELRAALKPLVERKLVVYLTPAERRGALLTHGFHSERELESARGRAVSDVAEAESHVGVARPVASHEPSRGLEARVEQAFAEIEQLKATVEQLQHQVQELQRRP